MPLFSLSNRVKRVRCTYFRFHFWLTLIITILFTQIYFWFGNCVFSNESSLAKSYFEYETKSGKKRQGEITRYLCIRDIESQLFITGSFTVNQDVKSCFCENIKKKNERHTEIQSNTFYKDGWIRPVKIIQNNVYFTNIDL